VDRFLTVDHQLPPPGDHCRYVQLDPSMTRSIEVRFAIVGFVFGGMIALYMLTARPQPLGRIDARRNYGAAASAAPGSTSDLSPVYAPPSVARVAQMFLLDLDRPDRAVETLKGIPDYPTRVISIQWLLNAPEREVRYDQLPEEKQRLAANIASQIGKIIQPLLDLVTTASAEIQVVEHQDEYSITQRAVDSMLRIARFLHNQGDDKGADAAAEIARKEAQRFAVLTPPKLVQSSFRPFSSIMDTNDRESEGEGKTWYRQLLVLLWPILSSAFCFAIASAAKPVLEAVGKAVLGKAIADHLKSADVAKALGLVDSQKDAGT
jgi:hypothetical protein